MPIMFKTEEISLLTLLTQLTSPLKLKDASKKSLIIKLLFWTLRKNRNLILITLQAKMYLKIRFLKFLENQSLILVFKDTTAQYLLMDKRDQERHILFKVSIKLQMGQYLI